MLSCRDVSVSYDGRAAVSGVSLDVGEGDCLFIVGENGSGKSTLMKCMLGLLKPASGSVTLNGLEKKEIGYMSQASSARKDFPASVREVVLSGCANRLNGAFYCKTDRERSDEAMERLGIASLAYASFRELSGGERQRVLLARALCAASKLIMLDEPSSGFDPKASSDMYELMASLNKSGVASVIVSHDIHSALRVGSKILHMRTSPLFYGSAADYAKSDAYCEICAHAQEHGVYATPHNYSCKAHA